MNTSEQWLNGGNCELCRRYGYCSKPCTKAKRRTQRQVAGVVSAKMFGVMTRGATK